MNKNPAVVAWRYSGGEFQYLPILYFGGSNPTWDFSKINREVGCVLYPFIQTVGEIEERLYQHYQLARINCYKN